MSSRATKMSEKGWSKWEWESKAQRWYRARKEKGKYIYEYKYSQTDATPRNLTGGKATSSSTNDYLDSNASPSLQFYNNDNYGYQSSSQAGSSSFGAAAGADQVNQLSNDFAQLKTDASDLSRPADMTDSGNIGGYNQSAESRTPAFIDPSCYAIARTTQSAANSSTGAGYPQYLALGGVEGQQHSYTGTGKAAELDEGYCQDERGEWHQRNPRQQQGSYGSATVQHDFYPQGDSSGQSLPTGSLSQAYQQESMRESSGSGAITPMPMHLVHRNISPTGKGQEPLDKDFKVKTSGHFKPGHIFKVLWTEPKGSTSPQSAAPTDVTKFKVGAKHGQEAYESIRRFVIVANDYGHCQCLPILTYNGRGTAKPGVKCEDHAIIYTGNRIPKLLPGEPPLIRDPVQVIAKTSRDKLEPLSRLNYAKIYTVEHNVRVLFIGHIAPEYKNQFARDFDAVWYSKTRIDVE